MDEILNKVLLFLPYNSVTYKQKRSETMNIASKSSFDVFLGRLSHFNFIETAKFDMICSIVDFILVNVLILTFNNSDLSTLSQESIKLIFTIGFKYCVNRNVSVHPKTSNSEWLVAFDGIFNYNDFISS